MHFPEKAPRIGIKNAPSTDDPVRVNLAGDPFHFGKFDDGDEFAVCDYDLPDENLTQITRGLTRAPVRYRNRKSTEILCREYSPDGDLLQLVRRVITRHSRFGQITLIASRRPNGMGTVEQTGIEFPMMIEPKARWNVVRNPGPDRQGERTVNIERITGLVDLHVGKSHYRCLRWLRPRTSNFDYREAEEIFIEVTTGLTVLLRGFIGKGYPDLDTFQRSPKLEVGGEMFHLRYIRRIMRHGDPGCIKED